MKTLHALAFVFATLISGFAQRAEALEMVSAWYGAGRDLSANLAYRNGVINADAWSLWKGVYPIYSRTSAYAANLNLVVYYPATGKVETFKDGQSATVAPGFAYAWYGSFKEITTQASPWLQNGLYIIPGSPSQIPAVGDPAPYIPKSILIVTKLPNAKFTVYGFPDQAQTTTPNGPMSRTAASLPIAVAGRLSLAGYDLSARGWLSQVGSDGLTPLGYFSYRGDLESVSALLTKADAPVNYLPPDKISALCYAASYAGSNGMVVSGVGSSANFAAIVKALVGAGANVNAKSCTSTGSGSILTAAKDALSSFKQQIANGWIKNPDPNLITNIEATISFLQSKGAK